MKKLIVVLAMTVAAVVSLAQPSSGASAGQFCKKTDVGVVTVASNGATIRCSYDGRYYRWVAVASPPTSPPTTAPPTTRPSTTTTTRPTTSTPPPTLISPTPAAEASVRRLYLAYFLREPDRSGLSYWTGLFTGGRSLAVISEEFARSSEFVNRYGDLSNAAFVDLIYTNLFGRKADPGGRSYWAGVLDRGRTRGAVMIGFSESAEFVRLTTPITLVDPANP